MLPSSRTPEGWPNRCPLCGHAVWVEPSSPPGDAPCPFCGHLLWFERPNLVLPAVPPGTEPERDAVIPGYGFAVPDDKRTKADVDRTGWAMCAVLGLAVILTRDRSLFGALAWVAATLSFGHFVHRPATVWVETVIAQPRCFWRGIALAWGLGIGPVVGCVLGVLGPAVLGWPIPCWLGGAIGLVCVPVVAAAEGLTIVGLVVTIVWIVTRRRLDLF